MSTIKCTNVSTKAVDYLESSWSESALKIFRIPILNYYHLVHWLYNHLNEVEKTFAKKFHFKKDTNRFIICRALLKLVLAHHIKTKTNDLIIDTDIYGKPFLKYHKGINFNMSHSDAHAIFAIDKINVGVDIEFLNYEFDYLDLLSYSFGPLEREEIKMANDSVRTFYKFWTRKEALVKMTGKGIDDNLNQLQVIDGTNYHSDQFFDSIKNVEVASFVVNDNHIASIAKPNNNDISDTLFIFDLPKRITNLQHLIS